MVSKLKLVPLGIAATLLGAVAVWLALGMRDQAFLGLAASAVGVAAIYRPDWAVLATVPVSVIGIGWPLWRVAALSMIAATGFALAFQPRRVKLTLAHAAVPMLVLALVASAIWPQVIARPLRHFDVLTLIAGVILFAICAGLRMSVWPMCATVALTGSVTAMVVLAAAHYGSPLVNWDGERLGGLGQNSNGLGLLLSLPFVACAGLAWHRREPMWLLAGVPVAIAIWLTESRGATVALFCGAAYVFLAGRRWWYQISGIATSIIAALAFSQQFYVAEPAPRPAAVAIVVSSPPAPSPSPAPVAAIAVAEVQPPSRLPTLSIAGSRSQKDIERSNDVRFRASLLALQTALSFPLRGIGYAAFPDYAATVPGFGIYMNTHNEFLRLAVEAGLPALVAFLVLLWFGLRPRWSAAFAVPRALVVTYVVFLFFGNPLSNVSLSIVFWTALGILVANPPVKPPTAL